MCLSICFPLPGWCISLVAHLLPFYFIHGELALFLGTGQFLLLHYSPLTFISILWISSFFCSKIIWLSSVGTLVNKHNWLKAVCIMSPSWEMHFRLLVLWFGEGIEKLQKIPFPVFAVNLLSQRLKNAFTFSGPGNMERTWFLSLLVWNQCPWNCLGFCG